MFGPSYYVVVTVVLCLAIPLAHRSLRHQGWSVGLRWLLLVLIGGLLVGTISHTFDVIRAGFTPHPDKPRAFNLFWTSLLVLDPLGAWLLAHRTRAGLLLLVAIMATDILVNVAAFGEHGIASPSNAPLRFQLGFGVLAFLSAPILWRHASRLRSEASDVRE